jgi:hypothetical protein
MRSKNLLMQILNTRCRKSFGLRLVLLKTSATSSVPSCWRLLCATIIWSQTMVMLIMDSYNTYWWERRSDHDGASYNCSCSCSFSCGGDVFQCNNFHLLPFPLLLLFTIIYYYILLCHHYVIIMSSLCHLSKLGSPIFVIHWGPRHTQSLLVPAFARSQIRSERQENRECREGRCVCTCNHRPRFPLVPGQIPHLLFTIISYILPSLTTISNTISYYHLLLSSLTITSY